MKHIKIFLASSEELTDDRNAFGNLVRRLDRIYEQRGIRVELFEWEDYDAAWSERGKQNEYNDQIKASDMFLALFHTKAGKYTIEEFDVATEEFRKHASPKVYVYCKDLQSGEQETAELKEFKRKLFEEMGHYWSRYNNRDSMQLHFVMQLQLVETNGYVERLKVEDGMIVLDGMPIARMDNLQFAAGNEAYCKMNEELATLPKQIEKARSRAEKYPDDEDLLDDLQSKLNRYNSLKEEFAQLQKALFETARRITIMQQERVSDMLRRAIEAFEKGNLERANTILDEIAQEAEHHMEQLDQQRELIHQDIDAFLLQAKTVMADASVPIDDRIKKTSSIYAKADEWAEKSALPDEKYETLLDDYSGFLYDYGEYESALDVNLRQLKIRKKLYGPKHIDIALSFFNIGSIYFQQSDYTKALEYYNRARSVWKMNLVKESELRSPFYNNIGVIYDRQGYFNKALDYHQKALRINQKILGEKHFETATSYNNIGTVYSELEEYGKALENYFKALNIRMETVGDKHPFTANSYNNIGVVYVKQEEYEKALEHFNEALRIHMEVLGLNHQDTAVSFHNIGSLYEHQGCYEKALEYSLKALHIYEKVYGTENYYTAVSYDGIGKVYAGLKDYSQALKYHFKALAVFTKIHDSENLPLPSAVACNNIGFVYYKMNEKDMALKYLQKALSVYEKLLSKGHSYIKEVKAEIEIVKQTSLN